MKDVKTNIIYNNQKMIFIFEIPVLEEKNLFNVYKVSPIPIFIGGKTIFANIPITYIALSTTSNEYSLLTYEEYNLCMNARHCTTKDILRPLGDKTNCVVKTLDTDIQACSFSEVDISEPFYRLYNNHLVYSVKGPLETKFKCKTGSEHIEIKHQLKGVGLLKVAPDCHIFFQDKYKAFSNPKTLIHDLGEAKFMDVFNILPTNDKFKIPDPVLTKSELEFPKLNTTKIDTFEIIDLVHKALDPKQALPDFLRALIIISILILLLFILFKCSPVCNTWFKTFIWWKNPKHWWTMQGYDFQNTFEKIVPNENRRRRLRKFYLALSGRNPATLQPISQPNAPNDTLDDSDEDITKHIGSSPQRPSAPKTSPSVTSSIRRSNLTKRLHEDLEISEGYRKWKAYMDNPELPKTGITPEEIQQVNIDRLKWKLYCTVGDERVMPNPRRYSTLNPRQNGHFDSYRHSSHENLNINSNSKTHFAQVHSNEQPQAQNLYPHFTMRPLREPPILNNLRKSQSNTSLSEITIDQPTELYLSKKPE